MRSRRDISPQTRRRTTRESSSMSTTSLPISCAARAAATISSPTWTPYWSAIRTWNWASNPRTDQPRRRGSRLMIAWYRTGSSSRATTFGCRARTSARIAAPMSKTWPTPRIVIIPEVTIPRATITLCFDEAAASLDHRENRSRTMRPYIRTMSSARTRPCRTVRCRVRMWWTTARSLPRSTISPISNSSSGAARTSCGTVRFPLLTENLTRTRSIRFAQTVATSFARAAAPRRPWASTAVTSIRESPRSSSSPTATFSSGENSREVRSDLSSHETTSGIWIGFGSRVTTVDTRPQFGHFTVPSKTISSLPPILPRRTRWGASAPHASHFRTSALGAATMRRTRGRRKGFVVLETSTPSAVARDSPEPPSQRPGASRTPSGPDERFDPCLPGLRQIRAFRLMEHPLQFGGRREVFQGADRDESSATPAQRGAHEEPCSRTAPAPDPLLQSGGDRDESEEVHEDVRRRGVHELERDPRPRRRRRASRGRQAEIEDYRRGQHKSE